MGSGAHPWRSVQAWDRGRSIDRRQLHDQAAARVGSDVEDVLTQPCGRYRLHGLPCRPDDQLSPAVRLGHPTARTATLDLVERHRPSDSGVDRATDHGGLSLGRGAYPSHTRPRRRLWPRLCSASGDDGHPGSPDCASFTLAEWPCGETDWLTLHRHPGMFGKGLSRFARRTAVNQEDAALPRSNHSATAAVTEGSR